MRARNIKPGYYNNEELAACDPLARILFSGLWCLADREGRLEDRPKRIKRDILGYDDCDVDALLDQLQAHGFIHRYSVGDGRYIQTVNFDKHQRPHANEQDSVIPPMGTVLAAPDVSTCDQGSKSAQPREQVSTTNDVTASSLILDTRYLIPDTDTGFSDPLVIDTPSLKPETTTRARTRGVGANAPVVADAPHAFVVAFLKRIDKTEREVAPAWLSEQHKHAQWLIEQGFAWKTVSQHMSYLDTQEWRTTPVASLATIRKTIPDWEAAGKPASDRPRGSPNGAKPSNTDISRQSIELVGDMVRRHTG